MTREDIQRIIEAQGYRCQFQDRISQKGDGRSWVLVCAWTRGGKSPKARSFGRVEEVAALSKGDLERIIKERFAGVK